MKLFLLPPTSIKQVLAIKDRKVQEAWLHAYCNELANLVKYGTFEPCELNEIAWDV